MHPKNLGLFLGQIGFVTGTNPVCPRDMSGVVPRATGPKSLCSSCLNSGVDKRVISKRVVLADVPPERKPERGCIRMFPQNENRNEGTFACSPGTKNRNEGTFAKQNLFTKPPFYLPVRHRMAKNSKIDKSIIRHFSTIFGTNFPAPFGGALIHHCSEAYGIRSYNFSTILSPKRSLEILFHSPTSHFPQQCPRD